MRSLYHSNSTITLIIIVLLSFSAGATTLTADQNVTDADGHVTRLIPAGPMLLLDFGMQDAIGSYPVRNGQFLRTQSNDGAMFIADIILRLAADSAGSISTIIGPQNPESFDGVYIATGGNAIDRRFEADRGIPLRRGEKQSLSTFSSGNSVISVSLAYTIRDRDTALNRGDTITFVVEEP